MKRQEVFDKVAAHLLTQKARAVYSSKILSISNRCSYRAENGLKCAIGALIPDYLYDERIEGCGLGNIMDGAHDEQEQVLADIIASLELTDELTFLLDLQNLHDSDLPDAVKQWPERLLDFALDWDLDPSVAMAHALEIK